jgi:thiol-disulfide isomerase/thioredoxin
MNDRQVFAAAGILALLAGGGLWLAARAPAQAIAEVAPSALFAATFTDTEGKAQSLGHYQGRILVINFWATWCGPCREEMPAFKRLQDRWAGRGVQFVGLANEEPLRVERFGRDLGITYPLWVGGDEVGELSRRLGNHRSVLPYTVLVDPNGRVVETKVGPYSEADLDRKLTALRGNLP